MDRHPLIEQYLAAVCLQIKARELHKEIKQEMADHLEELVSVKQEEGLDEEAAVRWAVDQMGDPAAAGMELNRVHKPRIAWGLLGGVALLLVISLIAMYAVELSYAAMKDTFYSRYPGRFLQNKAVFTVIGLGLAMTLSFFDYRRLQSYSWVLYTGTILVMFLVTGFGTQVNGMRSYIYIGGFGVNWMMVSVYTLIIAAAGILINMEKGRRAAWLQLLLFVALPVVLFSWAHAFSSVLIYAFAYLLLFVIARRSWRELLPTVSVFLMLSLFYLLPGRYLLMRLAAFFDRGSDPQGAGYMYIQIDNAVRSAGWWGHGFASVNTRLPLIHSDTLFTYLIYSLGWLTGGVILLCAALFIIQMVHVVLEVRDRYGKALVSGLSALFAVQFVWSLGMSVGVLPFIGVSIPLISYGGSQLLIQMAGLGLVLGVYRRKDMIQIRGKA